MRASPSRFFIAESLVSCFVMILSVLSLCFNFLLAVFFVHISCWVDVGVFSFQEKRGVI